MNRCHIIIVLLFFSITTINAQDVRYYKLIRKIESNISSTDVSGGQFITFVSDLCFESNKNGVGVGHGTMKRNNAYSDNEHTTYQGSSYWGKKADYIFNSDKSVLNVVCDNGNKYIYKQTTPPANQETCSLIRKSTGGNGSYIQTPIYTPSTNTALPSSTTPSSNINITPTQTEPRHGSRIKEETCPVCHGTKTCETCLGRGWRNNPYTGHNQVCPTCHGNKICWKCNGTGKITKTEYY